MQKDGGCGVPIRLKQGLVGQIVLGRGGELLMQKDGDQKMASELIWYGIGT